MKMQMRAVCLIDNYGEAMGFGQLHTFHIVCGNALVGRVY